MIDYRPIKSSDLDKISELLAESFKDYPLFEVPLKDEFKSLPAYLNFSKALHTMQVKVHMKNQTCILGLMNDRPCSLAILERPHGKEGKLLDYIMAGGLKLLAYVGLGPLLNLKKISTAVRKKIRGLYPQTWYVELLGVDQALRGQSIGSKMIEDAIIPYVKGQGGKAITLVTNTEKNRQFYLKNKFEEVFEETLEVGKMVVKNWAYLRVL